MESDIEHKTAFLLYFICRDYLGSLTHITDASGNVIEENSYDAWGRLRNPANYNEVYSAENQPTLLLGRGYTGHEHMPQFGLINMNARLYDPAVGRFLSPDPYVPNVTNSQDFNRYSYARNNPMVYTDPDGENPVLIAAIIIGAAAGGYTGYKIADAKGYDMGNWQTYGYMVGGAVIGGVSGYAGATIAAGGGFMANTMGIMYSSAFNSMGMAAISGGMISPSVSFGFGSLDFGTGKFRSIFDWKDLSTMEKIGYSLGALSNLADLGKAGNLLLNTEKKDIINHSAILDENGNRIISQGPGKNWIEPKGTIDHYLNRFLGGSGATNEYPIYGENMTIKNVNITTIKNYGKVLDFLTRKGNGVIPYSFLYSSCSTHTGLALNLAGIPTLFLHPYTVQASVWLWNAGITPAIINNSFYMQNYW